jgi:hypothetical protein
MLTTTRTIGCHFAHDVTLWTAATSLVNWDGGIASLKETSALSMAASGHLSIAPVFALVIAWALSACTAGMK